MELPLHDQATEVRLNSRRKARKPVMPIPKRAIEVGSGTAAVGAKLKLTEVGVPTIEEPLTSPVRNTPVVSTLNVSTPPTTAAGYVKTTSLGGGGTIVGAFGAGTPLKLSIAVTGAEKKKSTSLAVAPGTDQLPVTVSEPACDGAASAKLAKKPAATANNDERFIIRILLGRYLIKEITVHSSVLLIHNTIVSIPARRDLTNYASSAIW
jgi:hypothetical protein